MVFVGLIGAFVAGEIIDRTKMFEEVSKVTYAIALICLVWFVEVNNKCAIYSYNCYCVRCLVWKMSMC